VSYNAPGVGRAFNQRITVYRYHVADPVLFHRSLRVSIEHGHANDRSDDYSSTAYWYQTLPAPPFPPFLPVAARLPRLDTVVQPVDLPYPVTRRRSGSPILSQGIISAGKAAELVGEPRASFELLLGEMGIPPVRYDVVEYERDLSGIAMAQRRTSTP
jgi:hypothetical protein